VQRLSSRIAHRAAGFSLIEVLITLGVGLLASSALIRFQGELFRADTLARSRSQAALLAEQRLETLYAAISTAGPGTVPDGADTWSADLTATDAAAAVYTRSWSTAVDAATGLARIDVAVDWNDAAGDVYDVRLAALADTTAITYGAPAMVNYDFIQPP
jgi:prepilin-type N-terminal cleavage/methylation domain-containing protein